MSDLYQSKYAQSFALVVGIDQYKYVSPLSFAKNDATAIAKVLKDRFGFAKANINLLLDKNATFAAIRDTYLDFANNGRLGPNDRLVVFFAGHGHTVSGARGDVGFLVPHEGNPNETKTLIRWDDLTRNADLIPAKHIFFMMDACYGDLALQRGSGMGNMRFLGDMLKRHARQVLTAGKADEVVADGGGVRGYEDLFDAFEVLVGLVYADLTDGDWGPIGRFGWKQRRSYGKSPFDKLVEEAKQAGQDWGPLKAGFFRGSLERFLQVAEKFKELLKHLPWF